MAASAPRKFTILDGMILVAATACGLGLNRAVEAASQNYSIIPYRNEFEWVASQAIEAVFPFLVTWTLAVLLMRLRRPRPRWRRLFRQPGTAACSAAILPIVFSIVHLHRWLRDAVIIWYARDVCDIDPSLPVGDIFQDWGAQVGLWILGAWLALALSGRRRPERSWIDRLGRALSIGWLMILVIKALEFVMDIDLMLLP